LNGFILKNIWTENPKSVLFLFTSRFGSLSTDSKSYLRILILVEVWQEGFSKHGWPPEWKNIQSHNHLLPPQIPWRKIVSHSCPSLSNLCSVEKRYTMQFKINFRFGNISLPELDILIHRKFSDGN